MENKRKIKNKNKLSPLSLTLILDTHLKTSQEREVGV